MCRPPAADPAAEPVGRRLSAGRSGMLLRCSQLPAMEGCMASCRCWGRGGGGGEGGGGSVHSIVLSDPGRSLPQEVERGVGEG